jgi:Transketolase, C-terminal subunit
MMESISAVIQEHENTSLFLVDIGVWGFRNLLKEYPERAFNIGIFEDGTISVAAGMALSGMVPFVYGISPFILGRAYEQLKLDFCYQGIGANFLATGAAYDFSTLGYSHYCQEDVDLVKSLPRMELLAPGTPDEFKCLFDAAWNNGQPTYYRLSDYCNKNSVPVWFGKAAIIKQGKMGTVIAVSTMLDIVLEACNDLDITILYYTTLEPFDHETLRQATSRNCILLCEPHYSGALTRDVQESFGGEAVRIDVLGMPREINRTYGTKKEKDMAMNFTVQEVRKRALAMIEN